MKRWIVKKLPKEVVGIFLERTKAEEYQSFCSQYLNGKYVVEQADVRNLKP